MKNANPYAAERVLGGLRQPNFRRRAISGPAQRERFGHEPTVNNRCSRIAIEILLPILIPPCGRAATFIIAKWNIETTCRRRA